VHSQRVPPLPLRRSPRRKWIHRKRGFEEREVRYKLSFDYVAGHLQLKEFVELKKISETKENLEKEGANE
jgi:hypothetical protein